MQFTCSELSVGMCY